MPSVFSRIGRRHSSPPAILFLSTRCRDLRLYLHPPLKAMVLCGRERPNSGAGPHAAHAAVSPRYPERRTCDYLPHPATTLLAAVDTHAHEVIGEPHWRHSSSEFLKFPRTIKANVQPPLDVHWEMDNYGTHKMFSIKAWFSRHPTLPCSCHTAFGDLAQSGRTMVRHAHRKVSSTRHALLDTST